MKEEWKVYIKGVPNRGNEVIKALTDLGAKQNSYCGSGSNDDFIFYIDHKGEINYENLDSEQAQIIMDNYKEIKLSEKWKRGDILFSETHKEFAVFESDCIFPDRALTYIVTFAGYYLSNKSIYKKDFRLATKSEIAQFYNYLHSIGKDWNEQEKKLINWKWKPKERDDYWTVIVGITIYKIKLTWIGCAADKIRYELGNCFCTCGEADDMLKKS